MDKNLTQRMKVIHKKNCIKGFTLLELVLYMSIFTILVGGVLYSSFYLQKVLEFNSVEYATKEQIYRNLELLQQHAQIATKIEITTSSIKITNTHGYVEQTLENGIIYMKYGHANQKEKSFTPFPYMIFEQFSFEKADRQNTVLTKSILTIHTKRQNMRNKTVESREYILVPAVDFYRIP